MKNCIFYIVPTKKNYSNYLMLYLQTALIYY